MTLTLSPTAFLTYEDCPRQYHYRYVLKAKPRITAANLVFGDVVHQVLHTYLQGWLQGQTVNPVAEFETLWSERTQTEALDYPAAWSPEALLATGRQLMEQFPIAWERAGLMPLLDGEGQPLLERRLQASLTDGVIFRGKLDCVALDREARVILLDFKTSAQATDPAFAHSSEQLTAYQWLLQENATALGIEGIDGVGFLELVKRKVSTKGQGKGPQVIPPEIVPPRDSDSLDEFRAQLGDLVEDIRRRRFPRRPRMAHNTPCTLCDYRVEICARLNLDLYRVNAKKHLEISDLIGHLTVIDGDVLFQDGPLTLCARHGWLLLLDEVDLMDPGELAGLNTVLDGGPLVIADNGGEVVHPQPGFGVIGSANTGGNGDGTQVYLGTQRMNGAFMDRFALMQVDYPEPAQEWQILARACPTLPASLLDQFIQVAQEVRTLFKGEDGNQPIEVTLSTRTLVRWARKTLCYKQAPDPFRHALDRALTLRAEPETREAILGIVQRIFGERHD